MSLHSFLVAAAIFIVLGICVAWIGKNDGWEGKGCGGNCASCHRECSEKKKDE